MPRLYSLKDDFDRKNSKYVPSHFFPSARWAQHSLGIASSDYYWKYDLEQDLPMQCYVHLDQPSLSENEFWIELRKSVERQYQGDCFYRFNNRRYKRWWNRDATADFNKEYNVVEHGYWIFYFENQSDQTMFSLQHGSILSTKQYRFHPEYGVSCEDERYDVPEDELLPHTKVY